MAGHDVLSTSEAAALLGVERHAVARWCRTGLLPSRRIQVGKRAVYRIRRQDLVAFARRYVSGDW
jgi:excisionase family DNA binding protein